MVIFLILFLLLFLNAKKYLIELTSLIIFTTLVLQFVPVFERSDPFFDINTNRDYQSISLEESNDLIGFEIISDPLNRTAPWTMFYEGYKPDVLSFIFGNGPGAYLNLVKNTDAEITSGPHSSVLQILNKFGLLNLLVLVFFLIRYVFNIMKTKLSFYSFIFAIVIGLLISFEIKTDSLMIMDGVYIFGFNLVLIYLIGKLFEERIQKL
jgi:O-antigen ligase